jgi:hypothetical protein
MTITTTHSFVSAYADSGDVSLLQPSAWNANHVLAGAGDKAIAFGNNTGGLTTGSIIIDDVGSGTDRIKQTSNLHLRFYAYNGLASGEQGRDIRFYGGNGFSSGDGFGGSINFTAGNGDGSGSGGEVNITAGSAVGSGGDGGGVFLHAGDGNAAIASVGGSYSMYGGIGYNAGGGGGLFSMTGGYGYYGAVGGGFELTGGHSDSGTSGSVLIKSGTSDSGNAGDVTIGTGVGGAGNGAVHLQVGGTDKIKLTSTLLAFFNATGAAQSTGYGTPTNGAKAGSFDATTITHADLAKAVAQLILDLKAYGLLGA